MPVRPHRLTLLLPRLLTFVCAVLLLAASPARALETVTLQLKHTHQFQFAGYYAAVAKGYYKEAGLDVKLVEALNGNEPERAVLAGRAEYGVGSSSLLLARMAGKPLVVLGVIFQHSPYVLLVRQHGSEPNLKSIIGQKVMIGSLTDELTQADELVAFLRKEGIDIASLVRVEHTYNPDDFINGRVEAVSAFSTNEPDYLDRIGFMYDLYSPRAAGIDFYGDNLFTSEKELREHPARVRAFREASMKGWQYAMTHPDEIVDLILAKYTRRHDRQHLLYEARQMVPLVQPVLVEIGYMNPQRWRHIADVYADVGMLPKNVNFDGFLYNPDEHGSLGGGGTRVALWIGAGVLALVLVYVALLVRERRRARATIRQGEQRFRTMFEQAPMGIALIDAASGACRDVNPRFADIAGRPAAELRQTPFIDLLHPDDAAAEEAVMARLDQAELANHKSARRLVRPDGSVVWIALSIGGFEHDGVAAQRLCMIEDITDKKQSEAVIWQQANFDTLTQLPNRRMFHDRLEHDILKCRRDNLRIAVLFIDLDHFKEVNDTLGHHQGDVLLIEAARRIKGCVRAADTVARLGGDEFTVILSELDDVSRVDAIAEHVLTVLQAPYALGHEQAFVSASIGITLYPDDAKDADELIKHADQAMYAAKGAGRNRYAYFTPALQVAAQNRMRMTNDLRGALKAGQFEIHFQPIVSLRTGRIHKAEALLRWRHPQRGLVSPLEFIPLAEATGLIVDIGDWVFHEAAQWVAHWRRTHRPDFQVTVNQSPLEVAREGGGYAGWIADLAALGVEGDALTVEITEGLLLDASKTVTERLLQLRDAGIQVALDDFGTGYSSLSYLKKFDIDYLKIDRSFTRNLAPQSSDMALSEAIIVMAHKLGLSVIAEGVETEAQRALLIAAGCDYGQGYLFSRPLPAEAFDALLRAEPRAAVGGRR
ncbi:EAL domain-containing protein [Massilia sp. TS11]|uniref:EAL domain-containing protein n=1 Tax=Massilia sp. TS11 TaxID=2908003 RepID=UPI001EDC3C30|nr:EAL domain-containing protein [Massilia sp. TS11]MCG2585075.1 EAL domain-containing protein [Massilia sp. TS11]